MEKLVSNFHIKSSAISYREHKALSPYISSSFIMHFHQANAFIIMGHNTHHGYYKYFNIYLNFCPPENELKKENEKFQALWAEFMNNFPFLF